MMQWLIPPDQAEKFNHWELVASRDPSGMEWVLAIAVLVLLLILSVYNLRRLNELRWKIALFCLRFVFIAGLLALWLQPAIQLQQRLERKSTILALFDRSRSMSLPATDEQSRSRQLSEFIENNADWLRGMGENYDLQYRVFDRGSEISQESRLERSIAPQGQYSEYGPVLSEIVEQFDPDEIAAILLFGDGRERLSDSGAIDMAAAAKKLQANSIPVFSFGAGKEGGVRDLAISDLRFDRFAFVHNKFALEVDLSSRGYIDQRAQLVLLRDGHPISSQELLIPAEAETTTEFVLTPDKVGRQLYALELSIAPGDAIEANNKRRFAIDVIRDKIRVLHVCGHPDYDEQFLRRYLKNNPNIDLISFFILRTNSDVQFVSETELSLIPFPTDELFDKQLNSFDLVIFQNFTYRGYRMQQYLPNIRRYVMGGGALLVLGGDVSYGPGGYRNSAIEEVLPFEIIDEQPQMDARSFIPVMTEEGLRHPVLRILPGMEANRESWKATPQLYGLNLGLVAKPEALVLAEHPTIKTGGRPAPVIAAKTYGLGRVLALALDSTWRWHFIDIDRGGGGELYHKFYTNALRWLIKDPDLKHTRLQSNAESYAPGEEVRLDLKQLDDDFQPSPGEQMLVELYLDDDRQPFDSRKVATDESGQAQLVLDAGQREGTLRVVVRPMGATEGASEELLLLVGSQSGEMAEVNTDFEALRRLSEATGGSFKELPVKMDDPLPLSKERSVRIGRKHDVPIWDKTAFWALLVLVISLEWWLRKRKRLN